MEETGNTRREHAREIDASLEGIKEMADTVVGLPCNAGIEISVEAEMGKKSLLLKREEYVEYTIDIVESAIERYGIGSDFIDEYDVAMLENLIIKYLVQ